MKMELWQIDNSPVAPKFHVISAPNNWEKSVRGGMTQRRQYQLQFWDTFRDFCQKRNSAFSLRKSSPNKWYPLGSIGTGPKLCGLNLNVDVDEPKVGCEVHIPNNKLLFDYLERKRVEIERELGSLEWHNPLDTRRCRIGVSKEFEVIGSPEFGKYDEAFRWLLDTAENFKRVFSAYLSGYNPST